jgi:hypothetical protein
MFGTSTLMTSPVTLIVSLPRPPITGGLGAGAVAWHVEVVVGLHAIDHQELEVGPEDVVAGADDAQAIDGEGVVDARCR